MITQLDWSFLRHDSNVEFCQRPTAEYGSETLRNDGQSTASHQGQLEQHQVIRSFRYSNVLSKYTTCDVQRATVKESAFDLGQNLAQFNVRRHIVRLEKTAVGEDIKSLQSQLQAS